MDELTRENVNAAMSVAKANLEAAGLPNFSGMNHEFEKVKSRFQDLKLMPSKEEEEAERDLSPRLTNSQRRWLAREYKDFGYLETIGAFVKRYQEVQEKVVDAVVEKAVPLALLDKRVEADETE